MPKRTNILGRILDRFQDRFQRARSGSVMILVVTLLVLMALIGTAYISTARTDRYSAAVHAINTQIDLLLEGVVQMALGATSPTTIRQPIDTTALPRQAMPTDDPYSDAWLAARTPTRMVDATGDWNSVRLYSEGEWVRMQVASGTADHDYDYYVSTMDGNIGVKPTPSAVGWLADTYPNKRDTTPVWESVTNALATGGITEDISPLNPKVFDGRRGRRLVEPTFLTINGQNFPALRAYIKTSPTAPGTIQTVLATSTSGDGIADGYMWRLPLGQLNGVTYYASARIIDNNAAINLNTANAYLSDFAGDGTVVPNSGIFPSNIGLAELLATFPASTNLAQFPTAAPLNTDLSYAFVNPFGNEFGRFNNYRFTRDPRGLSYNRPTGIQGDTTGSSPIDETTLAPRPDFRYLTLGDALYMGLGRRIENPGGSIGNPSGGVAAAFGSLSWGESAALGYKFDLVNANANQSLTEQMLNPTLIGTSTYQFPFTPYDPSNVQNWFINNYAYIAYPSTTPPPNVNLIFNRRPLFVARNPVSILMPAHALDNLPQVPKGTALDNGSLITVSPLAIILNAMGYDPATVNSTPRVSLNTADLTTTVVDRTDPTRAHGPTLWLGFYNAMLEALQYPYVPYDPVDPTRPSPPAAYPQQFRSSLRDPRTLSQVFLAPDQMLLLRSLIAAVNAKDWRDTDDDVTHEAIPVIPSYRGTLVAGSPALLEATVYGQERQPFITEVYANSDTTLQLPMTQRMQANPNGGKQNFGGYVAIEIHNPSDRSLSLQGYTLGIMYRNAAAGVGAYPNTQLVPLPNFKGFGTDPTSLVPCIRTAPIIPAGGYIVLENYANIGRTYPFTTPITDPPPGPTDAQYRPTDAYENLGFTTQRQILDGTTGVVGAFPIGYYVPGLSQVFANPDPLVLRSAGELIVFRPRLANGTWLFTPPPTPTTPAALQVNPIVNQMPQWSPVGTAWYEANATGLNPPPHLDDMVPVDQFDFYGMSLPLTGATQFYAWHYARASGPATGVGATATPNNLWKFVYPGQWTPPPAVAVAGIQAYAYYSIPPIGTPVGTPPVYAIGVSTWDTTGKVVPASEDPWIATPPPGASFPINPAVPVNPNVIAINLGLPDPAATYNNPYGPIPLNWTGSSGPDKNFSTNPTNLFPFGGFARVGDVLQVPFIGAYCVRDPLTGSIYEMNSITADCALSDDMDLTNDSDEQIGRFCPIALANHDLVAAGAGLPPIPKYPQYTLFTPPKGAAFAYYYPTYDPYGWAAHVTDYFTAIQAPDDSYLPHTDPSIDFLHQPTPRYSGWNTLTENYSTSLPLPQPVKTSVTASSTPGPIEGLININTANWRVLAQVPFYPNQPQRNADIAFRIIAYRNAHGPFTSLSDLNRMVIPDPTAPASFATFQAVSHHPDTDDFTAVDGDFSLTPTVVPPVVGDGVFNDFEQRFQEITRVSNLLTIRSDCFTVYVQVQGWRSPGTATAELVAQRRAAFIVDRSRGTARIVTNIQTE